VYGDPNQMLLPCNFSTKTSFYMHLQVCMCMLNFKNTKYMKITVKCCCLTTFPQKNHHICIYKHVYKCSTLKTQSIWRSQSNAVALQLFTKTSLYMHFQVCVQWCDRWTSNNGQTKQPQPSPFPNGVYNAFTSMCTHAQH